MSASLQTPADSSAAESRKPHSDDLLVAQSAAIKGLAHPVRLRLLDLLRSEGELTATECAAETGESASNCSFHLRQLAKHGYITRVPGRGRERPWRIASTTYSVRPDREDEQALGAAQSLGALLLAEEYARLRGWVTAMDRDDPNWVEASLQLSATMRLALDDLRELSHELEQLAKRFKERQVVSEQQPGNRQVRLFGAAWAEIEPTDQP